MTKNVKSVNAYIKDGRKFVCIKTEDNDVLYVNEGLMAYAFQTAKEVKKKDNKNAQ